MGKAVKKKEEVAEKVEDGAVLSPFQPKDLSLEKRIELFQTEFNEWKDEMANKYGLSLDVELTGLPRAIVPRLVLVDLTKKQDGQGQQQG